MKILFLAPQPFFFERGTPMAVKLALETLGQRDNTQIDLLTYHEGKDVEITNVNHYRAPVPGFINNIPPGLSLKKLFCDLVLIFLVLKIVLGSKEKYDLVHAVEESVFIALALKLLLTIPYIYDMDSSLSDQSVAKWGILKPLRVLLNFCEKLAIKHSLAVLPVCEALAELARNNQAPKVHLLTDISFYEQDQEITEDLRETISAPKNSLLIIYIGNLEYYQGIDLLIDSFHAIADTNQQAQLVIIGGSKEDIETYKQKITSSNIARCHLLGPRPVENLSSYLKQADILTSPRIKGNNTPMKIYSYLHSAKVILATDLPTHTQVLTPQVAKLAAANTGDYSAKMLELLNNQHERETIGNNARELAEKKFTLTAYQKNLNKLYDSL